MGNGLTGVFARYRIKNPQIRIGPAFGNAPAQLRFAVWVIQIDDRERNPRIASRVLSFQRSFACTNDDSVCLTSYPDPEWTEASRPA
jgi:hypothetical protein